MASEEHLKILQQGVAVWNEWRKKNPELHPDLGKAVLYRGSAHETESIPLTEYCPIFRVPEYSECLLRTGFPLGFHWARTRNIKARRGKARCASTVLLSARSDMLPELARAAFC